MAPNADPRKDLLNEYAQKCALIGECHYQIAKLSEQIKNYTFEVDIVQQKLAKLPEAGKPGLNVVPPPEEKPDGKNVTET